MASSSSLSLSLKVLLISTAVLLLALLLTVSVPLMLHFSVHQAPLLWNSVIAWLKPPYLYVIINCIIITIAASSRFQHSTKHDVDHSREHLREESEIPVTKISADLCTQMPDQPQVQLFGYGHGDLMMVKVSTAEMEEVAASSSTGGVFEDKNVVAVENDDNDGGDEFVISRSTWVPPKRMSSSENSPEMMLPALSPAEKPLVSSRFCQRKPVKASPEGGRALGVSKPKRHETMENTWKMITEGRAMPLTRHLKKSDTWENHGREVNVAGVDPSHRAVKKSETFKDRTNYQTSPVSNGPSSLYSPAAPVSSGKLRKEPSLSQDELNRRVEAFIKKFNEEMRLQRQESLNQYKEMISRGSH